MQIENITLSALQRESEPNISSALRIPDNIDTERLMVNTSALGQLQRTGSFSSTALVSASEANPHGTGRICDPYNDQPIPRASHGFTANNVYLDPHQALQSAQAMQEIDAAYSLKRPVEYRLAGELSRACAQSFRQAGREHLLRPYPHEGFPPISGKGLIATYLGTIILPSMAEHAELLPFSADTLSISGFAAGLYATFAIPAAKEYKKATGHDNPLPHEKRWSLVPGYKQPDRYIALSALSRVTSLVKMRP